MYEGTWRCGEVKLCFSPFAGGERKENDKVHRYGSMGPVLWTALLCSSMILSRAFSEERARQVCQPVQTLGGNNMRLLLVRELLCVCVCVFVRVFFCCCYQFNCVGVCFFPILWVGQRLEWACVCFSCYLYWFEHVCVCLFCFCDRTGSTNCVCVFWVVEFSTFFTAFYACLCLLLLFPISTALREEGVLLRDDDRRPGDREADRGGQGERLRHRHHPRAPHGLAKDYLPLGHRRPEGSVMH